MTRPSRRSTATLVGVLCAVALLTGCSGSSTEADPVPTTSTTASTTTEPERLEPTAGIMAAAAHQLLTVDHTFGNAPLPFTTFLVQDRTDPSAGATGPMTPGGSSRPLTASERSAIEDRLGSLGDVVWIGDPDDHRTSDPSAGGSVIVGLGEPVINADTALAPVSLWCSTLCGTWFTYSMALGADGEWTVHGIEGPRAVA